MKQVYDIVDKWIDLFLSDQRSDEGQVESAMKIAHQKAKLPEPKFQWFDNPFTMREKVEADFDDFAYAQMGVKPKRKNPKSYTYENSVSLKPKSNTRKIEFPRGNIDWVVNKYFPLIPNKTWVGASHQEIQAHRARRRRWDVFDYGVFTDINEDLGLGMIKMDPHPFFKGRYEPAYYRPKDWIAYGILDLSERFIDFAGIELKEQLAGKKPSESDWALPIILGAGWFMSMNDVCYISRRPMTVEMDNDWNITRAIFADGLEYKGERL